jgi:hypothetical protein
MKFHRYAWWLLGFNLLQFLGCDKPLSPEVLALRKEYLSDQRPNDPISLTDAKSKLSQETDITLIGRIGSGKLDPFAKGQAQFVLSEAPAHDHGDEKDHDETECIFCRRRLADAPLAIVELRKASGEVVPFSANEALGIADGQRLVVAGRGKYNAELNSITVVAKQIYIDSKN